MNNIQFIENNYNQKMRMISLSRIINVLMYITVLLLTVLSTHYAVARSIQPIVTANNHRNLKSAKITERNNALIHIAASGFAAVVNFPLWRASAIAQSGFQVSGNSMLQKYWQAVQPPYRGVLATMFGMCWARAAIFYGSELGKAFLIRNHFNHGIAQTAPPFIISTLVQIINMPIVRATITIQDPTSHMTSVTQALTHIYQDKGFFALWHGVSAAIMKTVPKYITAVVVKDYMEDTLPDADPNNKYSGLARSAIKAVSAGVAGAALTNPLDVLRNEMFKTDLPIRAALDKLIQERGWSGFLCRGIKSNIVSVAIPIAITIFTTDMLLTWQDAGWSTKLRLARAADAVSDKKSSGVPRNQRNTV